MALDNKVRPLVDEVMRTSGRCEKLSGRDFDRMANRMDIWARNRPAQESHAVEDVLLGGSICVAIEVVGASIEKGERSEARHEALHAAVDPFLHVLDTFTPREVHNDGNFRRRRRRLCEGYGVEQLENETIKLMKTQVQDLVYSGQAAGSEGNLEKITRL